jgi:hypothetical protein
MKRHVLGFVALAALIGLTATARADDKKANLTGTWKWTVMMGNNTRDVTLKLKQDGDKLTGAMVGRNNQETPIEDATFKDGEVSFKVTRTNQQGQKISTTYKGKLEGDTIKGKSEREGGQPRDWEAKRAKD